MKTNKYIIGIAALAVFLTAGAATVSAYQGDYTQKGPDCTSERHDAMELAFNDLDYNAWQELMDGKGRVTQVINESNFNRFAEAHQLAQDGNYEEANTIRQELGLRGKDGQRMGAGYRGGNKEGSDTGMGRGKGRTAI